MVTMLVVILIGNWVVDLSCWAGNMRTLRSDMSRVRRQLSPMMMSETARP
jgi:hypothetical protein